MFSDTGIDEIFTDFNIFSDVLSGRFQNLKFRKIVEDDLSLSKYDHM